MDMEKIGVKKVHWQSKERKVLTRLQDNIAFLNTVRKRKPDGISCERKVNIDDSISEQRVEGEREEDRTDTEQEQWNSRPAIGRKHRKMIQCGEQGYHTHAGHKNRYNSVFVKELILFTKPSSSDFTPMIKQRRYFSLLCYKQSDWLLFANHFLIILLCLLFTRFSSLQTSSTMVYNYAKPNYYYPWNCWLIVGSILFFVKVLIFMSTVKEFSGYVDLGIPFATWYFNNSEKILIFCFQIKWKTSVIIFQNYGGKRPTLNKCGIHSIKKQMEWRLTAKIENT